MDTEIKKYYIPQNPNVLKGHIYTMYINNNTNMDLSTILNIYSNTVPITISQTDYNKLIELNNIAIQLTNKRTQNIQAFLQEETITTNELSKVNIERELLIKKLSKEKVKIK